MCLQNIFKYAFEERWDKTARLLKNAFQTLEHKDY